MRTTIDRAGRVVIPKAARDAAGLAPGTELEVTVRDGRVELEVPSADFRVSYEDGFPLIVADVEMPPLTARDVRDVLERVRR